MRQRQDRSSRQEKCLLIPPGEIGLPFDREPHVRTEIDHLLTTLGRADHRRPRDRVEEHHAERCRHLITMRCEGEDRPDIRGRAMGSELLRRPVQRQHHGPTPIARRERHHRRRPRRQEERAPPPREHPHERGAPLEQGESRRDELRGREIVDAAAGGGEAEGEGVHGVNDNALPIASNSPLGTGIFGGCLPILV